MSPEERAQAVIDRFRFPPGWRASYGMVEDIAAAIRAAVAEELHNAERQWTRVAEAAVQQARDEKRDKVLGLLCAECRANIQREVGRDAGK